MQGKNCNRVVFEPEAYGCKVTSKITLTYMVLLGDEVVANLVITGDGHIRREKFICEIQNFSQINFSPLICPSPVMSRLATTSSPRSTM